MTDFLTATGERILILDGAFGTWVQAQDLGPDDFGGAAIDGCKENLVLTRPDLIRKMHDEYFAVGVDAVETATFGAFALVLAEYDLAGSAYEMNVTAARLAKESAEEFSTPDRPRWVVGSLGPGTRLPSLGAITFEALRTDYQEQAAGLIEGGADVTALEAMRPDVIGLNCATGPVEMTEHLRYLAQHARTKLSCLPNAGLPSVVDGHTHYDLTPEGLADAHERFVTEFGLNIVGGCCGTTPAHLAAVVARLGNDRAPTPRTIEFEPGCSSIYSHVPYHQELAYLAIGERTNANGSKKFREAMLDQDWDTSVQMAKDQVKEGAHVLDVCVDYVGRHGTTYMEELAARFAIQAALPLVFDSTEPPVIETGLKHSGGKAILNSANLEDGEHPGSRLDRVFTMAQEYGAGVICLAIDEDGQARDTEWKLRVCKRIYKLATEKYGIDPTDLLFDMLTFPLGSGQDELRRDGIETIEAIR